MDADARITGRIADLLENESLGVLATTADDGSPYTSLVGFFAGGNLREVFFATFADTQKYRNIQRSPKVSLLIDTRKNSPADFKASAALTVLGRAAASDKGEKAIERYLLKFPHLESFISDPGCLIIKIAVSEYILVERFQEVYKISL